MVLHRIQWVLCRIFIKGLLGRMLGDGLGGCFGDGAEG